MGSNFVAEASLELRKKYQEEAMSTMPEAEGRPFKGTFGPQKPSLTQWFKPNLLSRNFD